MDQRRARVQGVFGEEEGGELDVDYAIGRTQEGPVQAGDQEGPNRSKEQPEDHNR